LQSKEIELNDEEKLILYSIGAMGNTPLRSKVKLQKILFLLSNVFPDFKDLLTFEKHLLGPFSTKIEDILDDLIKLDFVDVDGSQFRLSNKGLDYYRMLKPKEELRVVIEDFKSFLNDMTDDQILTFIYVFYPEYIAESAKWDDLKRGRIGVALTLLRRRKVNFLKAMEIAGMAQTDFEKLLIKKNIKWKEYDY